MDVITKDVGECSDYEMLQRKNIQERDTFLKNLNITDAWSNLLPTSNSLKSVKNRETVKSRKEPERTTRDPSRRIRGLPVKKSYKRHLSEEQPEPIKDNRLKGTVNLTLKDKESQDVLKNLTFLKESANTPLSNLSSSSLESFRNNLARSYFIGPYKVASYKIQSLCMHPTISKKIILAGCCSGSLSLWDVNEELTSDVIQFSYHTKSINCVTVSHFNQCKVFTTSWEGTVCCFDIDKQQCSNIFSVDFNETVKILNCHDEINNSTLLIARGNGNAGILDIRQAPNGISWINCFQGICNTVQVHPSKPDYFLVSSRAREEGCKIFDLRSTSKCISHIPDKQGIISSFFSPLGNYLICTRNKTGTNIYDSSSFEYSVPKKLKFVPHKNNVKGHALNEFQSKWVAFRNDSFLVRSTASKKEIKVYDNTGSLIYGLRNKAVTSITNVVATHPKIPIIAAANVFGNVHLFFPPSSENIEC